MQNDGYPDIQTFVDTYKNADRIVDEYKAALKEWEQQTQPSDNKKQQLKPPECRSVLERLHELEQQAKQQKHILQHHRDELEI